MQPLHLQKQDEKPHRTARECNYNCQCSRRCQVHAQHTVSPRVSLPPSMHSCQSCIRAHTCCTCNRHFRKRSQITAHAVVYDKHDSCSSNCHPDTLSTHHSTHARPFVPMLIVHSCERKRSTDDRPSSFLISGMRWWSWLCARLAVICPCAIGMRSMASRT